MTDETCDEMSCNWTKTMNKQLNTNSNEQKQVHIRADAKYIY